VNISAVLLTVISCIASGQEQSVLTAVQLLWINLIQDTFAALALATDPPSSQLLKRPPDRKSASIINFDMWLMILGQGLFQLAVTLVLTFAGSRIFTWDQPHLNTVVFNTYVWLQVFNQVNCRGLDRNINVFAGLHRNVLFLLITAVTVGGQIIIIFFGGAAFSVVRLNGPQWALCIVLGVLSLPFGVVVRVLMRVRRPRPKPSANEWNNVRNDSEVNVRNEVRENLILMKRIRSGRRLSGIESAHRKIQNVFRNDNMEEARKMEEVQSCVSV